MNQQLADLRQKAIVLAALTLLYPVVFTVGYLAIVKTAVIDKE